MRIGNLFIDRMWKWEWEYSVLNELGTAVNTQPGP